MIYLKQLTAVVYDSTYEEGVTCESIQRYRKLINQVKQDPVIIDNYLPR